MTDQNLSPDPDPAEPTVHELLLARINEHCPDGRPRARPGSRGHRAAGARAGRSCRNAITMASVMVVEIRLRAHSRPLDSNEQ
jgi:hypothetical protein